MDNGTVEFWNYRSTTMLSTIPGYAAPVASIKFIPGNRQYVISDIRGLIKVRNIPHDDLSSSAAGTVRGASSIEAAPNGSGFFYLASDTVIRFRTRTGVDALELKSHGGKLTSLSISPDGSMLAAASTQGEVYLYRIKGIETVVRKAIIKVLRNPGLSTADLLRPDAMETKLTTGMLEGIVLSDVPLRILRINEQPNPLTLLNSVPSGVTDTDRIYNYSFQYPFTIRFKYIDIVLESVDLLNGKTSKAVTIELEEPDTLKPEMFTLQPDDSVLAKEFPSKDSLPVQTLFSGLVSDNKGIKSFTVNGNGCVLTEPYPEDYKKATISEATMTGVVKKFETNVSLRVGKNTFELLAVDINNNKTIDTFRIYRQEPKPDSIVTQASPVPTALPKTWAVVIGVSKYANPEWNLKYADKDAELFYKFLKTKAGGEIPDSRIKLLLNSEATRENILAQVAEKLEMAHTGERVILYFAAHGMMGGKGELFFLGSNSDPDLIRFTGVPVRDIEDEIQSAVADVVVISDACHAGASSGEGFRGLMASEINYQLAQIAGTKKGVVWFSSSTANELSQEGPQWDGHGVFTKFLVDGLKGAADADKDNRITIVELEDYVKDKVRDATLGKQRPLVGGYHPDNMILSITK
jgi:WD40 repeat protein